MVEYIKTAAESVGIVAVVTNSDERIETQLNRLTVDEDLPIMLISWDIDVNLVFDENGFLENPSAKIVALLVRKPEDLSKSEAETTSTAMATLFIKFIKELNSNLLPIVKGSDSPITDASYKYVPRHGAGKHSGIMARWTQKEVLTSDC